MAQEVEGSGGEDQVVAIQAHGHRRAQLGDANDVALDVDLGAGLRVEGAQGEEVGDPQALATGRGIEGQAARHVETAGAHRTVVLGVEHLDDEAVADTHDLAGESVENVEATLRVELDRRGRPETVGHRFDDAGVDVDSHDLTTKPTRSVEIAVGAEQNAVGATKLGSGGEHGDRAFVGHFGRWRIGSARTQHQGSRQR